MNDQHVRLASNHPYGGKVLDRIIRQSRAETGCDRMGARGSDADGVAVGNSSGHNLGADIAACAQAILDDDCWPNPNPSFCAPIRATMSVLLPAGNGTIKRIARCGQPLSPVCATALITSISQNEMNPNRRAMRVQAPLAECHAAQSRKRN